MSEKTPDCFTVVRENGRYFDNLEEAHEFAVKVIKAMNINFDRVRTDQQVLWNNIHCAKDADEALAKLMDTFEESTNRKLAVFGTGIIFLGVCTWAVIRRVDSLENRIKELEKVDEPET